MKRGVATFTLDGGKCPAYLFGRMKKLGREMIHVLVDEYGPDEFIKRMGDPVWFQSLGTVLAFDWNASGLTTTLTAALKEAIRGEENDLGIFICGGKGGTSKKTPEQINGWGEQLSWPDHYIHNLVYNSRMSAKVDSALVQDNYQIYHHSFFFSRNGSWTVVQQGMNTSNRTARRYHWFSHDIRDLIEEPHSGIITQLQANNSLDLTSRSSRDTRYSTMELVNSGYKELSNQIQLISKHSNSLSKMVEADINGERFKFLGLKRGEFSSHPVELENLARNKYLEKILRKICEARPENYEEMLSLEGVGPKTIRSLALVSEVVHGAAPSYKDPARYSFAHGGKDGTPYMVDRSSYDKTIKLMIEAVRKTDLNKNDKDQAISQLQTKLNSYGHR